MRLWHQLLIPHLPRAQLLGQHREAAALRGLGWGRPHATVDYVFRYGPGRLAAYHFLVMDEMQRRGYRPSPEWRDPRYRGRRCEPCPGIDVPTGDGILYPEHDPAYLLSCLDNLARKGVVLSGAFGRGTAEPG